MSAGLSSFLLHWAVASTCMWAASHVFSGIRFADTGSLLVAALLFGVVNALVRPILIFVTLPLTLITLGGFLLVINAMMLLLVAWLVRGFNVSGFWTALFASIFISLLTLVLNGVLHQRTVPERTDDPGVWL